MMNRFAMCSEKWNYLMTLPRVIIAHFCIAHIIIIDDIFAFFVEREKIV